MTDYREQILISGASSTIAQALIEQFRQDSKLKICAVSRRHKNIEHDNIQCIASDYSESHIAQIVKQLQQSDIPLTKVFICNGILHDSEFMPEKKLEEFEPKVFEQVLQVNTIIPSLWIKHLVDVVNHALPCTITAFSARVGSISDNRLGGWYSYRASKAALNMMIKTSAVEYARRAKNAKLLAFHPGTTNTALSKPFQRNVPAYKLFTPEFVAEQLLRVIDSIEYDRQASFIDWQGKEVCW